MLWHGQQPNWLIAQFCAALLPNRSNIHHRVRAVSEQYRDMKQTSSPAPLTTARGAALYIGALLGPGLLLLPGLAAVQAGPASVLAWAGLLVLSGLFAVVFGALGRSFPSAGGVIGYVRAGLGARASLIAGWSFLAGVVAGAPVVCLIGAGYVTELTGGGTLARALIAALLLLTVLALAAGGLRTSAAAQLLLVALLVAVVMVAVAGSAHLAQAANWAPFAPHGWQAVGHAASTLMLSFVGWEAAAPLTTRFADPARQLPRVIGIALAVTSVLYLGLAVTTIGVLGAGAGTSAPLAGLLRDAAGPAGQAAAAAAAVVLTLGAVNAYVTGAAEMTRELIGAATAGTPTGDLRRLRPARLAADRPAADPLRASADGGARPAPRFLAVVAGSGLAVIALYGAGLVSPAALVALPTTLFLVVYLGCMASASRVLRGRARLAAAPATVIVAVVLSYCGWALLAPAAVIVGVAAAGSLAKRSRRAAARGGGPATAPPGPPTAGCEVDTSADSFGHLECQTPGVA
jgi:amino acid efflux transporter